MTCHVWVKEKSVETYFMYGKVPLTVSLTKTDSGIEKTLRGVNSKMNVQNVICGRRCILILQYWWRRSQWIWFDNWLNKVIDCWFCLLYFYVRERWDKKSPWLEDVKTFYYYSSLYQVIVENKEFWIPK